MNQTTVLLTQKLTSPLQQAQIALNVIKKNQRLLNDEVDEGFDKMDGFPPYEELRKHGLITSEFSRLMNYGQYQLFEGDYDMLWAFIKSTLDRIHTIGVDLSPEYNPLFKKQKEIIESKEDYNSIPTYELFFHVACSFITAQALCNEALGNIGGCYSFVPELPHYNPEKLSMIVSSVLYKDETYVTREELKPFNSTLNNMIKLGVIEKELVIEMRNDLVSILTSKHVNLEVLPYVYQLIVRMNTVLHETEDYSDKVVSQLFLEDKSITGLSNNLIDQIIQLTNYSLETEEAV